MPEEKCYSSIKCFRISFVVLLLTLLVAGIVIYTNTNIQGFIGIILIATPSIVLLAVLALTANSYCHYHFSHSLDIHGVTDGLEFDEIDLTAWYSNRTSRRTSITTTQPHRLSLDPNSPILDLIPDDNSDIDENNDNMMNDNNVNQELLSTEEPANSYVSHTIVDVIPEEDEEELDAQDLQNENNENTLEEDRLTLPTYEDAISNYDEDDASSGVLPTYQEAVLNED